tara:strand:- start:59 stop:781 length:723 start_codon:yes stop_codon:yes gene_type:complete
VDKILILGCSFSAGSYVPIGSIEHPINCLYNDSKGSRDILINRRGWYYHVNHLKDKDITVIPCPGLGYWAWYQILLFLEDNNELIYDEIWIQEASPVRASIFDVNILARKLKQHVLVEDNIKLIDLYIYEKDFLFRFPLSYDDRSAYWINFYTEMSKACASNIDKLCKNKNIKGYVFTFNKVVMECEHFTRLKLSEKNLLIDLLEKNLRVKFNLNGVELGQHLTEEGNKFVGELINNEMG